MSGGVVYGYGIPPDGLGKYGEAFSIANGAKVPPGVYYVDGTFSITDSDGDAHAHEPGLCLSDGSNCVVTAACEAVPIGAGKIIVWPWPKPWPDPSAMPEPQT